MTEEEFLRHCEAKVKEYWEKYHSTHNRETALVFSGMASAYDELIGFIKNGY